LEEVSELSSYLNTGWFNIIGESGEPIFHAEITMRTAGRVLEVSKVYSPGHSEILASVAPATTVPSRDSSLGASLPPHVLEVYLSEGKPYATIESWGNGSYTVVKDGMKAFAIGGNAATLELSVLSARTGRPAARIERKGVNFAGAEHIELVVLPGWCSGVFILACVLSIITLRSWPTLPQQDETLRTAANAKCSGSVQRTRLINVIGDSSMSLSPPSILSMKA